MIKHYGFDSRSIVAWMKMCRSGSVMGPQHFFFERYEQYLKITRNGSSLPAKFKSLGISAEVLKAANATAVTDSTAGPSNSKTRIARPPRKNNIIHIVPGNRREIKKPTTSKPHLPVKGTQSGRELRATPSSGKKRSRSTAVITPPSSGKSSSEKMVIVSEKEKKIDTKRTTVRGNSTRSTSNPAAKLLSRVMRTPAATPTSAARSRTGLSASSSKTSYKIPTCYVNITETESHTKMADHIHNKKNAPSKGPTLMRGRITKSYEALKTGAGKHEIAAALAKTSRKNLNSSNEKTKTAQPTQPHQQTQLQQGQMVTRSMKKHFETFGFYPKSVKGF